MGFGVALLIGVLAAGILYYTMSQSGPEGPKLDPQGLDSFQINQNQEGSVVPMVWGKVRISTNFLWYGNLETEPVYSKGGGKGGSKKTISGYRYYLDMWHAICQGPNVTISDVYIQDKKHTIAELPVTSYDVNDGSQATFPTEPGAYAAALNPVVHISLNRYLLGVNVSTAPTLHFIVERTSDAPLLLANPEKINMTNGVNPAAIVWDLLRASGVPSSSIDVTSFEAAAEEWYSKGYGLNITLNKQQEVRNHIKKIQSYVDFALRVDENDKFIIHAFTDSEASVDTLNTEDFNEFKFSRRTWDDCFTDFRANFTDQDADYTQRTLRVRNPAVHNMIGHDRQKTIDLTAYRDSEAASQRLHEVMKRMSYPEAQIQCKVSAKFSGINVGEIVTINHDDYAISAAEYRVTSKTEGSIDTNDINLTLTQYIEGLMDDNYGVAGRTSWVQSHYGAAAPANQRIIELPYTGTYQEEPAYLCMCERAGQETGFEMMYSVTSGGDFGVHQSASFFSELGTVSAEYPIDTRTIDDDVGLTFTRAVAPTFDSVSRAALFAEPRIGVLYDPSSDEFEIIAFQTVTPLGGTSYQLTGVIRGLLNTEKQTWAVGKELWLVHVGDNIMTNIMAGTFYVKLVPFLDNYTADESGCAEITVNYAATARTPWPPYLVRTVGNGAGTFTATIWPTTRVYAGGGVVDGAGATYGSVDGQTDQWPPEYVGAFQWATKVGAADYVAETTESSYTFTYSDPNPFSIHNLRVRALVNGFTSPWVVVAGAQDNTTEYYGQAE